MNRNSFAEIINSPQSKSIRLKMQAGEKPAECQVCFRAESRGVKSKRLLENEKWPNSFDEPRVKYLDLRFGTNCNLRCVMCSASESSSWERDTTKYIQKTDNFELREYWKQTLSQKSQVQPEDDIFWKSFAAQLPTIEEIYFAGGEPLLQDGHWRCLDLIHKQNRQSQIRLVYNTNGTAITPQTIEMWSQFKNVQVNLSLDALRSQNEYIRFPSKWTQVDKVLKLLDSSPENLNARITCTIQALNIFSLKDIVMWKIESNFKKIQTQLAPGDIDLNILHFPLHLNVQIFSKPQRMQIDNLVQEVIEIEGVSDSFRTKVAGLGRYLNESQIAFNKGLEPFLSYLSILDSDRGLNSHATFPFLKDLGDARL